MATYTIRQVGHIWWPSGSLYATDVTIHADDDAEAVDMVDTHSGDFEHLADFQVETFDPLACGHWGTRVVRAFHDEESEMAYWDCTAMTYGDEPATAADLAQMIYQVLMSYGVPPESSRIAQEPLERPAGSPPALMGPQEIAAACGVRIQTVHAWRGRDRLPEPFQVVSGVPVWWASVIDAWAVEKGYPKAPRRYSHISRLD